jgi:hypothetical protein
MGGFRWVRVKKPLVHSWLLAAMSTSLAAQGPDGQYDALKTALALSDVQIAQCRQASAKPTAYLPYWRCPCRNQLDDLQRSKLDAIMSRPLHSNAEGALANWLGLNDKVNWGLCTCGPCRIKPYASQLGFSDAQMAKIAEFEKAAQPALDAQFEEAQKRWLELLNSDAGKDSPEAKRLGESINYLLKEKQESRLQHDVAFGLLNDKQKALAADLENTFLLIGEAIDLNLLPRYMGAEGGLCH